MKIYDICGNGISIEKSGITIDLTDTDLKELTLKLNMMGYAIIDGKVIKNVDIIEKAIANYIENDSYLTIDKISRLIDKVIDLRSVVKK